MIELHITEKNCRKYFKNKSRRHKKQKTRNKKKTFRKSVKHRRYKTITGGGYTTVVIDLLQNLKNKITQPNSTINNDDIIEIKLALDNAYKHYKDYIEREKRKSNYSNSNSNITSNCASTWKDIGVYTKHTPVEPPTQILKDNIAKLDFYNFGKLATSLMDLLNIRAVYKCIISQKIDPFRNVRRIFKNNYYIYDEDSVLLSNSHFITNIYMTISQNDKDKRNEEEKEKNIAYLAKINNIVRPNFDKDTIHKILETIWKPVGLDYSDNIVWTWYFNNHKYYNKDYKTASTGNSFFKDDELAKMVSDYCKRDIPIQNFPIPATKPVMNELIQKTITTMDLNQMQSTCADRYIIFLWYIYNYAFETNTPYIDGEFNNSASLIGA